MHKRFSFTQLFAAVALGTFVGSRGLAIDVQTVVIVLFPTGVLWLILEYRGNKHAYWLFWIVIMGLFYLGAGLTFQEVEWSHEPYETAVIKISQVEVNATHVRVVGYFPQENRKIAIHLPPNEDAQVGDKLIFSGFISEPSSAPNPGVFCYKTYLAARGVEGVCWPEAYQIQKARRRPLTVRMQGYLADNIRKSVEEPGLILALVLGDRSQLSQDRQTLWGRLGAAHLLAISGTHLGLLMLMVSLVLDRLPIGRLCRFVIVQLALAGYVLLSGAGPSTLRAFLVVILSGWAELRGRRRSSLETWSLVGCILLLSQPHLIYNLSFQLSFVAAGGIILWGPVVKFSRLPRVFRPIASSLYISTIAQLSLMPLLLAHFRELALLAPAATLVLMPFVVVLMAGGMLVGLGAGCLGVGILLDVVQRIMLVVEQGLAKWAVVWSPPRIGVEVWLTWMLFVYAGWRLRQPQVAKPRMTYRRLTWAVLLLVVIVSLPPQLKYPLEVTALNVGQGDCILIRTPYNQHVLIDGGGDSLYWQERGRNVGLERVVPYLKHRGIDKLDVVILSHPHEDHLFGLLAVLEDFEIGVIYDTGKPIDSPSYTMYKTLIQEKGIPHVTVRAGDVLRLRGGPRIRFLHPHTSTIGFLDHNDASVTAALDYQRATVLFTGDIERLGILDLLERTNEEQLRADLVKVPHHGSLASMEPRLYSIVNPEWAFICVGPNSYGHPHPDVLDYLTANGIRWRTTEHGPISFYTMWGFLWPW